MPEIDTYALPLLPLTTGVVLPGMVVTLTIESDEARAAVDAAAASGDGDRRLLLVPRSDGRYARVGTVATIEDVGALRNGTEALVIRGLHRAVVGVGVPGTGDAVWVQVEPVEETEPTARAKELAREYRAVIENIVEARGVPQVAEFLRGIADPGQIADTSGYSPDLSLEQKIEILETLDIEARLELALGWAKDVLADLELKDKIRTEVSEGMEKRQREFLLREQMSAIRKELGEDGEEDVVGEYRTKIEDAGMPEDVRKEAERELGRLERTSEQSPEYGWIRTYLDWMTELPWSARSEDNLDIAGRAGRARRRPRGPRGREGPDPGVPGRAQAPPGARHGRGHRARLRRDLDPGRSSGRGQDLARRVRRARSGARFVRVSLGGIHDEAEIRGHRRTYVGALPGRIVRALKDAGTKNPVMMLDEIDKVGADWRGDPSSALLEVLDPAQNHTFRDHYLDVDLDLSEVLFITTANVAETIPGPAVRPDGGDPDRRLHRGREGRDRQAPPGRPAGRAERPPRRRGRVLGRGAPCRGRRLHPRGRRAEPRAGARQGPAEGRDQGRRRGGRAARDDRRRRRAHVPGPPEVLLRGGGADGRARRGHRPGGHRHRGRRAVHRGESRGRG